MSTMTASERVKEWRAANIDRYRAYQREYQKRRYHANLEENREYAREGAKRRRQENPEVTRERARAQYAKNPEPYKARMKAHAEQHPALTIFKAAKYRAKRDGIEFSITLEDIVVPEFCPILGLKLKPPVGPRSDRSPSLDRIDNSIGYTKLNTWVICDRANRIKNDGTAEEHDAIAKAMRKEKKRRSK